MKVTAGFNMVELPPTLRTRLLHFKSSVVSALLGVAFGHRDLQTLPCLGSLCGDFSKKEFIGITNEVWGNLNTMLNRLLQTLTQKYFTKSHETH
jgi:hypothetical protein